uniref:Thioredoxin-like protein n=1 Tax=Tetraselmis sp. GSL018 TaxID=582737 RepID=A0A061S7V9_9CHLO
MDAQAGLEQHVLTVARALEEQVDSEISKLDNLGESEIDQIRSKRIQEMKRMQEKRQLWLSNGHGEYREIFGEKEFFKEMKGVERMVCHFYRDNWPCKVMDKHLAILAQSHIETKFVRIHAEKSPYLVEKLKIFMLPTLALIKKEKVEDYIVGFDPFGGTDDFSTDVVFQHLEAKEMVFPDEQRVQVTARTTREARSIRKGGIQTTESDEDSDFGD